MEIQIYMKLLSNSSNCAVNHTSEFQTWSDHTGLLQSKTTFKDLAEKLGHEEQKKYVISNCAGQKHTAITTLQ